MKNVLSFLLLCLLSVSCITTTSAVQNESSPNQLTAQDQSIEVTDLSAPGKKVTEMSFSLPAADAMQIPLTDFERLSLFAVRPEFGNRFLKNAVPFSGNDPLSRGDRLLLAGKYKEALNAYHPLRFGPDCPEKQQAFFHSMIAHRRLGAFRDAMADNEALIKSPAVPERIKAFAQFNLARIALDEQNDRYTATLACNQLKANRQAPPELVAAADRMLLRLQEKLNAKTLTREETAVVDRIAAKIRPDHPRIFFNRETLPLFRNYLERPAIRTYYEQHVKLPAAKIPDSPQIWNGETGQGRGEGNRYAQLPKPTIWGLDAARCAMIFLVEGDRAWLEKAKQLLKLSGPAMLLSFDAKVMAGDYYSTEVIYALAAYDWIYSELTPEERSAIVKPMLEYIYRCEKEASKFVSPHSVPEGGFYGVRMLKWYGALAAIHDRIDEETARKLLYEGYTDHEIMLANREQQSSDDGGLVSTANNYTMVAYLWASYNYLLTYESATGEKPAGINHLKLFPQWCVWNYINGHDQIVGKGEKWEKTIDFHDFGIGDTGNTLKTGIDVSMHMYEIMHFLADDPDVQKIARPLLTTNPLMDSWMLRYRPLAPLFLFRAPILPEKFGEEKPAPRGHARFFEEIGIVFMRSGSTKSDTYACFVTNKKNFAHRHYDANHFMIYKYDFLALDTGTRIGFQRHDDEHLNNYYCQSVAHNTVLIHMPEEPLPNFWTIRKKETYFNHGGQNSTTGDRCVAYETNDFYTYVAGDATPVFAPEKCRQALRQFVFVYPDLFIIADRVTATRPEYRKEWLLHTQNEPVFLDPKTWYADDGGGRMFCRALLPADAGLRVVGGPGHEFESSGRNWELPDAAKPYAKDKNYLGRYRVETSPTAPAESDVFLHVIQVGADTMPRMIETRLLEDQDTFGVAFSSERGDWEVRFRRNGLPGGSVSLTRDGKSILNRPLRSNVEPQSGIIY